jgi:TatD DNase family protein
MRPVGWIDAHCHLADRFFAHHYRESLRQAGELGITGWISTALNHREADFHRQLNFPAVKWCAGIPPMKPSDLSIDDLAAMIDTGELAAIGEIGLDDRFPDPDRQQFILEIQLDLAVRANLPVVLHLVRAADRIIHILDRFPGIQGIIHGYVGPAEFGQALVKRGFLLSLGPRIFRKRDADRILREAVAQGRFSVETDAPQTHAGEATGLETLPGIVRELAQRTGVAESELQAMQYAALDSILGPFEDPFHGVL